MAKQAGYTSLETLMKREVLPLTGCKDWEEVQEEFDPVAVVRAVVRAMEYQGRTYYLLIPGKTDEERRSLVEQHRKRAHSNRLTPAGAPSIASDIPTGTLCDRCVAPAQVRAQFQSGPLFACQHHANEFGWWVETLKKEV